MAQAAMHSRATGQQALESLVVGSAARTTALAKFGLDGGTTGVLLFGPSGCSKTTLVRTLARAAGATLIALAGADVYSTYVGDAEVMTLMTVVVKVSLSSHAETRAHVCASARGARSRCVPTRSRDEAECAVF